MSLNILVFALCMISNKTNMSNVHPLKVVGRGSETQHQIGEFVFLMYHLKG